MAIFAVDCETTGLNPHLGDRAFLISRSNDKCEAEAFMLGIDSLLLLNIDMANPDNEWVGHNLGFDLAFLEQIGLVPSGPLHDTMVAAHVYNANEPSKSLKDLAKKYLKRENHEEQKVLDWFYNNGMRSAASREYIKVPEELIIPYAKADVEMTMALFKYYKALGVMDSPIYKLEMQVLPIVKRIVARGMKIDHTFAQAAAKQTASRALELAAQAKEEYGIANLASSLELADRLRKDGVKLIETAKNNPKLDEASLAMYDHPLVSLVQEYRTVSKMNSTYLQPMLQLTDNEGVLHASLNQVGTKTGRFSSSSPNIENIPRSGGVVDIRRGFITRGRAFSLLLVDLSQIELRVLAHYCQEPVMLDALRTRAGDLHAATSIVLFGEATKAYRTVAKTLNFATIYGAGPAQIARSLNKRMPDRKISVDEARKFKRKYFESYPKLQEFVWAVTNKIRKKGVVHDIYGRQYECAADVAYRAVNYLIQGCAAGICKKTVIALDKLLQGTKSGLVNIVHDEFIFDLHEEDKDLVPTIIATIEDHHEFRVPIFAAASISETNWAEKHPLT